MTVYEVITSRICEKIQSESILPWQKPWKGELSLPKSLITKKAYRGSNVFILAFQGYESPWWMTFKQCNELGGSVKARNHGTPIVYWNKVTKEKENKDGTVVKKDFGFYKYSLVFNLGQTEDIPESKLPAVEELPEFHPIEDAERIVSSWQEKPDIGFNGYNKAFYNPARDFIGLPKKEAFFTPEEYYSTLFHELVHSTGHEKRLNRLIPASFGSHEYSKEELVAEMGATFLSSGCGIERTFDNSVSYLNSWLKAFKGDPRMIISAGSQAQKGVEMILGKKEKEE